MADNPLKYSDLLQPDNSIEQAIEQLKTLNNTYSETLKTVKSEAIKLQASIENVSGATETHRTRIRETTAQVDKLTKAQQELEFAMSDNAKKIAELNQQKREAQNIAKLTAKLNSSEKGSYNALSAQYSLNKIQLNKLSQEYRENTKEGQKLVKETEEIYAKMKQLQEVTGKYTLNVGNYKSAWNGLGVSAQQLVRELPSLAVSANTFFLAISNNIPMLVDEINNLKAANKAAAAEGNKTVPVWKSVVKAFLSWNTAISLGVTLLTLYGGDLIDWVSGLIKGKDALDEMKEAMDGVNQAEMQGRQDAQQSLVRLNLLYSATQDVTKSINERRAAVEELKKEFPDYFSNLTEEKILAGEAATQYNMLAKSILATAMARAAEDKMIENAKKILELDEQRAKALGNQKKAEAELATAMKKKEIASVTSYGNSTDAAAAAAVESQAVYNAASNVRKYGNEANEAAKKIKALETANKRLAGKINVQDLVSTPGNNAPKTTTATRARTSVSTKRTTRDNTQQIEQKNLEITKELYKSETDLITDELEKQRKALQDTYNSEYAELMNKYKNEKELTEESRENINQIILNKQAKLQQDLQSLDLQEQQRKLQTEQETLQLRLDAVEQGSEEENSLRIQLLENARKQELLKNSQLIEEQKQSEADINAKYDRQILDQENTFKSEQTMLQFDQQQALNKSEFDLLETTEKEKTDYKLKAERDRLKKLLELAQSGAKKMSEAEIETLQNNIKKIDQEIEKNQKTDKKDIYDLIGLKLNDEQKKAISESVGFSIDQLQSILEAQVQIKDQALQNAQEEVDAAKDRLDQEIEARNNGYANNVATAQKELELARKNEEKALKDKKKAQRQQQAIDALTQSSSLITASAEIWKSLSGIKFIGYLLAIAAISTMWTSFAAAKVKARQVTNSQTYGDGGMEFLSGGSHQSGNDIDLGTMPDGRPRRAEGGEAFAVINKKSTRKYRKALPGIIKSINSGVFESKYMKAFGTDGLSINVNGVSFDSRKLEKDVREIKEQGQRRYIVDGKGRTIEYYKNLTIIRK